MWPATYGTEINLIYIILWLNLYEKLVWLSCLYPCLFVFVRSPQEDHNIYIIEPLLLPETLRDPGLWMQS